MASGWRRLGRWLRTPRGRRALAAIYVVLGLLYAFAPFGAHRNVVVGPLLVLAGIGQLVVSQPEAREEGLRVPVGVFGHREIAWDDVDHVTLPHPFATRTPPTVVLRDGSEVVTRRTGSDWLAAVAAERGLPVERLPAPRSPGRPASAGRAERPMDVGRAADEISARDAELRRELRRLRGEPPTP